MRKRYLVGIIGLLVLALVLVAGCGSKEKPASVTGSGSETKPAATENADNDLNKIMVGIKSLPGYSCDMVMTGDNTKQLKSKLYASGSKVRMEMEADGVKSVMIINAKGEIWSYMPTENVAMKMAAMPETTLPTDWAASEDKPQIVGNEKVDGNDCLVLTTAKAADTKIWVMKAQGLPVKIESMVDGKKTLIAYKNYKVGAQPDDLFAVPAGAQVVSIPGAN